MFWKKKPQNQAVNPVKAAVTHREYKTGTHIGGEYEVINRFVGGMGYVYLVKHRELDRPIVLKTLKEPGDQKADAAFRREVEAWISLGRHPNIVDALFYRSIDGLPFIAAEYVRPQSGGYNSLDDYIAVDVKAQTILKWAIQFCDGLEYANANGLLAHRDIKPSNLLVDDSGNLKISDFGLARLSPVTLRQMESAVDRNAIAGTLRFMAPEQFLTPDDLDGRADIWAFGLVLCLLVDGTYPFIGASEDSLVNCILNQPAQIGRHFLYGICERCLRKDRKERFGSPSELREALVLIGQEHHLIVDGWPTRSTDEGDSLFAKALSYRGRCPFRRKTSAGGRVRWLLGEGRGC